MEPLLQAAVTLGLSSTLTIYFVWEGRDREKRREKESLERESRLGSRIDTLEDFQRNQLVDLVRATSAALLENAAASRAEIALLTELKRDLQAHHNFAVELGNTVRRIEKQPD